MARSLLCLAWVSLAVGGALSDGDTLGVRMRAASTERQPDDWYLGAKTDGSARALDVPLDFLDPGRAYSTTMYRDAANADWQQNATAYTMRPELSATATG